MRIINIYFIKEDEICKYKIVRKFSVYINNILFVLNFYNYILLIIYI